MSIPITITGNVTGDPELRFLQSGIPTATFTVAVSKRVKDGDGWKDGPTSFVRCTAWRQLAENVAESIGKGTRVIVTGQMAQREWEDPKTGERKQAWDVTVDEVGPSLRYVTATLRKVDRQAGGDGFGSYQQAKADLDDPWTQSTEGAPF
jgi:single-strand DNA-binding protein